jgi:hypothetical protein
MAQSTHKSALQDSEHSPCYETGYQANTNTVGNTHAKHNLYAPAFNLSLAIAIGYAWITTMHTLVVGLLGKFQAQGSSSTNRSRTSAMACPGNALVNKSAS